jgi:hypothetical protein
MAGTATPIFPQTIKNWTAQILPATASAKVTLVTGATNGSKVESINIASTDTTARDLQLILTISSVDYILGTLSVLANTGFTNAVPSINVMNHSQLPIFSYDNNGNRYLYVASGSVLSVKTLTTVTAAKEVDVFAFGGDF